MTAEGSASGMSVTDCRDLARRAHAGQVDKLGRDYFTAHLEPIADLLTDHGVHAVMAGLLHDVIEDTDVTAQQLLDLGVPPSVVRAVESVSKRPDESYDQLIARAAADPLGRQVKLADNQHNLAGNAELAESDPETAQRLRAKYEAARATLLAGPSDSRVSLRIQCLDIDAHDPHALADFWAAALGWVRTYADETEAVVEPPTGSVWAYVAPDLLFLRVPDDKVTKNRLHLDLRPIDQAAEVARLESLGARKADVGQAADARWVVMADPEGNEFCILPPLSPENQVTQDHELAIRTPDGQDSD